MRLVVSVTVLLAGQPPARTMRAAPKIEANTVYPLCEQMLLQGNVACQRSRKVWTRRGIRDYQGDTSRGKVGGG